MSKNPYKKSWDVIKTTPEGVNSVFGACTLDLAIDLALNAAKQRPDCDFRVSLYIKEKDMYHDLFQVVHNPEPTIVAIV